jgi:hypothetical protein
MPLLSQWLLMFAENEGRAWRGNMGLAAANEDLSCAPPMKVAGYHPRATKPSKENF